MFLHLRTSLFVLVLTIASNKLCGQDIRGPMTVSEITIIGNTKTKPHIILRELTFQRGDTIQPDQLQDQMKISQGNLTNTLLFNFVTINPLIQGSKITIFITVAERWYAWPIPLFDVAEPNINQWLRSPDFARASYGMYLAQENFRGRRESLRARFQFGYQRALGIVYRVPYLNKKQKLGMEVGVNGSARNEALYGTMDNDRLFHKSNTEVVRSLDASFTLRYRNAYFFRHELTTGFTYADISDSLLIYNPTYLSPSGGRVQRYINFAYRLRFNNTDYINFPTRGFYGELTAVQRGVNVMENDNATTFLGTRLRYFRPLNKRLFYATGLTARFTLDEFQPYITQTSIGYRDHIRGFEYAVIDAQHYGILKNQIRWALIPQQDITIKAIPIKKFERIPYAFYIGFFNDLAYASAPSLLNSPRTNRFLSGTGAALDFVTYYDRILRIEYSFNNFGESGIFVHFTTPI